MVEEFIHKFCLLASDVVGVLEARGEKISLLLLVRREKVKLSFIKAFAVGASGCGEFMDKLRLYFTLFS